MKKNTKHNLLEVCLYILLAMIVAMISIFIYGILNKVIVMMIVSGILFVIFCLLVFLVFRLRPYKSENKTKKNKDLLVIIKLRYIIGVFCYISYDANGRRMQKITEGEPNISMPATC